MREDPEDHVLHGALLLEDHPGKVEEDLIPFHLQLALLVELRVSQADATELKVTRKHLFICWRETGIVRLIYHLKTKFPVNRRVSKHCQGAGTKKWRRRPLT